MNKTPTSRFLQKNLAPDFLSNLFNQRQFRPLLFFSQLIADLAGSKPHCGLRYNLSRGMYFAASWIRAITASLFSNCGCFVVISPRTTFCPLPILQEAQSHRSVHHQTPDNRHLHFLRRTKRRPRSHRGHCWHKLNGNCPCRHGW